MFGLIAFTLASALSSDSLRMESINGKPYVIYQVGEKETLYGISKRYGATIASVLEQNPKADAGLEVGQILKIPYSPKVKSSPATQTQDGLVHKVAAKETLFSIARQYNVSVDDLKAWNSLKENSISVGQEIIVKGKTTTDPVVNNTMQPAGARTHTVVAKETLYSIAKQYGMTVQQLKEWNNIQNDELKLGQVLSVAAAVVATTVVTRVPVNTNQTPVLERETTIKISEGVNGTDEMKETGLVELIDGSEGNRKYLGQHRSIKPGTILKIRNLATNQEVFVRVTGPMAGADEATIIRISRSAYDRLGATEPKFRAEITYYK